MGQGMKDAPECGTPLQIGGIFWVRTRTITRHIYFGADFFFELRLTHHGGAGHADTQQKYLYSVEL